MSKLQVVEQTEYGVYVWRDKDGNYVVDEDRNFMLIASKKGDLRRIEMLRKAAESYGIEGGQAEFQSGARPVSDAEFEMQKERQAAGLVPDPYDYGNALDEYRQMVNKRARG